MESRPLKYDALGPRSQLLMGLLLSALALTYGRNSEWSGFSVGALVAYAISNPGWSWMRWSPGGPTVPHALRAFAAKAAASGSMLLSAAVIACFEPFLPMRIFMVIVSFGGLAFACLFAGEKLSEILTARKALPTADAPLTAK